jgi:catechol 2,3-dioxygenase-like lactoylglutathione lyase family enzyme
MPPVLDHITLSVTDYARSKRFYERALEPLGIRVLKDYAGRFCGFGQEKPEFWIGVGVLSYQNPGQLAPITPVHVAFAAASRAQVDAFWKEAIEAGGADFGAPGPRPQYHPNYYGAFVLDPDGHNVEAVIHRPE